MARFTEETKAAALAAIAASPLKRGVCHGGAFLTGNPAGGPSIRMGRTELSSELCREGRLVRKGPYYTLPEGE